MNLKKKKFGTNKGFSVRQYLSFIVPFPKDLLITYYVPNTQSDVQNTQINKMLLSLMGNLTEEREL